MFFSLKVFLCFFFHKPGAFKNALFPAFLWRPALCTTKKSGWGKNLFSFVVVFHQQKKNILFFQTKTCLCMATVACAWPIRLACARPRWLGIGRAVARLACARLAWAWRVRGWLSLCVAGLACAWLSWLVHGRPGWCPAGRPGLCGCPGLCVAGLACAWPGWLVCGWPGLCAGLRLLWFYIHDMHTVVFYI